MVILGKHRSGLTPARRRRFWPYAATGILCVAGAVVVWNALSHREYAASIVVLPFANLTGDPANQYFPDGLTDEITDSLARLKSLRVIARYRDRPLFHTRQTRPL